MVSLFRATGVGSSPASISNLFNREIELGDCFLLWGGLEMVPARSHKPNYEGSSPSPATNIEN